MAPKDDVKFDVDEDSGHQAAEWRFQRIGWVIWTALIVLALAGLLGPGPLSETEARSADGQLRVKYRRFDRRLSDSDFLVHLGRGAVRDGAFRLKLCPQFLRSAETDRIEPEPGETIQSADGTTYVFPADGSGEEAMVRFRFRPVQLGRNTCSLALDTGALVELKSFVFP